MSEHGMIRGGNEQRNLFLLLSIIIIGANLRASLTSVGALIPFIREDLLMSHTIAGLITTLPLIAFAFFSPLVPRIANRISMGWTIAYSLFFLMIGIVIRSLGSSMFLFTGTILIGLSITVGNVLIPALVKINFPLRIGLITALYAVVMNVFGALGSGLSVPLSHFKDLGWTFSLCIWGLLTLIAFILWLPQLKKNIDQSTKAKTSSNKRPLWRSSLAWNVTLFMGSQSFIFYTSITWLPDLLISLGYTPSRAGWLVFLMQAALIPFTFITPIIAERMKNQVPIAIGTACLFIIGYSSLFFDHTLITSLGVICVGIGSGSAFSLAMMLFTLRTKTGSEAAELSGMAQSFGYLLAAIGPVWIGFLYDMSKSWHIPLFFNIFIGLIVLITGMKAGREVVIQSGSVN